MPPIADLRALAFSFGSVGLLTALYFEWLGVTNPTIVALSFLLIVLLVAALSRRWIAIATSLLAFLCFNYFFLPPVGTLSIADPENLVALFTLLAVSIVASHLSTQVRLRAQEAEIVRRSNELKSALLASLSHDLKTPLTAVTVAANNLDAAWLTPEQRREQAEIVRMELARLNRLFQDIVDMARVETNAVFAELEWVHPSEIVDAAARQAAPSLVDHTLEIDTSPDGDLVKIDPRLTSAALSHLLENAGQYSPPGSTITVTAKVAAHAVEIAVRDRGAGVSRADLEHIFERFYRGLDARQQRFGTGMGLAITKGLLAAENGSVSVQNHPAGGAVFTLVVPGDVRPAAALQEDIV